jgi:hypothetical protein
MFSKIKKKWFFDAIWSISSYFIILDYFASIDNFFLNQNVEIEIEKKETRMK